MAADGIEVGGMGAGRPNQRRRTRKDLLQAASRLLRQGRTPSLEEIGEEAMVSRATAYRYFPSAEALLLEASLDVAAPEPEALFAGVRTDDPVERLDMVDAALAGMISANEPALRRMLIHALQLSLADAGDGAVPARQNRRTPLIEAALAPARARFRPADLRILVRALALVIGTEAMVVCKDVLRLDDAEARKVRRWTIRALVDAARRTS
jgi:AcrR family transcriptional regulator